MARPHCTHENCGLPRMKSTVGLPWPMCCRCGLVVLKNDVSIRAARQPCPGRED